MCQGRLEINPLVSKKFIVKVVLDFVHVGGNIDIFEQVVREIPPRYTERGLLAVAFQEGLQQLFGQEAVMLGI
jgi:hypothetical protein